jgi:hypothetical protein
MDKSEFWNKSFPLMITVFLLVWFTWSILLVR